MDHLQRKTAPGKFFGGKLQVLAGHPGRDAQKPHKKMVMIFMILEEHDKGFADLIYGS